MFSPHKSQHLISILQAVLRQAHQERTWLEVDLNTCHQAQKQHVTITSRISSGVALSPVRLLQARLRQQETRCQALQGALKEQQGHSLKILQGTGTF